ncbi:23S rRNA (uracil(1939)-C(5))-methyltransferase RlmD [bacterium F11]|nr:23S rRNA (uracil(1939)-C(5))-methyltransferase RlmD [bacterium F11]
MKSTTLKIDRLANGGEGIGRLNEKVVFVPYTLPGEVVQCVSQSSKKNYSRFLPVSVKTSSPHRIQPRCSLHFQSQAFPLWCGGCEWQHMDIGFQGTSKKILISETLERLGGLSQPPVESVLSSPESWRYRNKVQIPFRKEKGKIIGGFFAPASHQIVEFDDCPIQSTLSVDIFQFVRQYANQHHWSAYDEDRHQGWLRHLLIRTNQKAQALVVLVTKSSEFRDKNQFGKELRSQFPQVLGLHQNIQSARGNVILGSHWNRIGGSDFLEEELCGRLFRYGPGSFFQVNTQAAALLYQKAIEALDPDPSDLLLDLYSGVGCLAILAADKVKYVLGVEVVASAVRHAKMNAQLNKVRNVEFSCMKAENVFQDPSRSWIREEGSRLKVLLDPPRTGCDPSLLTALLRVRPKKIVYVSCYPGTLARDLKFLSKRFVVKKVTPVDMFPHTSHIESVTTLECRT